LGDNAVERLIDDYLALKKLFPPHNPPDHWHRTLTLSAFRAGNSPNQVPDTATARFDIRYTENDDVDALLTAIEEAVEGEVVVKLKEPVFTGGKSPSMNLLLQAAGTAVAGFEHGASDARFLSAHNIDGVVWGAEGNNTQHTLDEHVEIDSVFELCRRLEAFLHLLQNAPTTE
jgi:succinyl-diaminopimelate desuccinylase